MRGLIAVGATALGVTAAAVLFAGPIAALVGGLWFTSSTSRSDVPTVASSSASLVAQDEKPRARRDDASRVDDFIRHARTGSAIIRPQAAARLVRVGTPAGKRLLELATGDNDDLALFGSNLVEVFGQFPEVPELRARLWPAVRDTEFPWRPAAMRGLAWAPRVDEGTDFAAYVDDPIGPVRTAALDGLFRVAQAAREAQDDAAPAHEVRFLEAAVGQLDDEVDRVRNRAAVLLHSRGHARGLRWLVQELQRTDSFFDRPTGLNGRYEALGLLVDLGFEVGNYAPELPDAPRPGAPEMRDGLPTSNAAAMRLIKAQIEERIAEAQARLPESLRDLVPAEVPPIARATRVDTSTVVLGLELRSCRRGDYFLRWTSGDELLVGDGVPERIPLAEGATAKLLASGTELQEGLGPKLFWGIPGCDVEAFRLPRTKGPADFPLLLTVANDGVDRGAPRPGALTAYGAALAASIPTDAELMGAAPRTRELAQRVRAAFASIGGPLE
ncbi:MAG: hypothetical protein AAFU73_19615 [Planctomycetota bacterium]